MTAHLLPGRRILLPVSLLLLLSLLLPPAAAQAAPPPVVDTTVTEVAAMLADGETTSVELVRQYLRRVTAFEDAYGDQPGLNAIINVNPRALERAAAMDADRAAGVDHGPLHGVPVLVKDNFDTGDMPSTSGSLPLATMQPAEDATQIAQLRDAGAIIIAKANLHEFAGSWETVSSLGGQTRNPYDQTRVPGGSSGGTSAGVAASFAPIGMGSDTCGSIRVPASNTALVGLRATPGLTSLDGIFPMSSTQDVGGPMGMTVEDVALVMDATAGYDPADPSTVGADEHVPDSYLDGLSPDALDGARIGIFTDYLGGSEEEMKVTELVDAAADDMEAAGATVVEIGPQEDLMDAVSSSGLIFDEMYHDTAEYFAKPGLQLPEGLAELTESTDRVTLSDVFATGDVHPAINWMQGLLGSPELPNPTYLEKLEHRETAKQLLEDLLDDNDLDALAYPSTRQQATEINGSQPGVNCNLSAHTGFPALVVPAGLTTDGVPVGVELLGMPFSEPELLALGHAYEQATGHRVPPASTPERDVASCEPGGSSPYADAVGNTHEGAIACLHGLEIVRGFTDGTFGPRRSLTRGQTATMLYGALLAAGMDEVVDAPDAFEDDDGSVHEPAIDALAELGVLRGTADGSMAVSRPVTRGQLASMINRALVHVLAVEPEASADAFADDDGSVHEGTINALASWGVFRGTADGRANVGAPITRDQASSLLTRALF